MMSLCGLLLHHRFTAWVIDLYILCWDLHGARSRSWEHFYGWAPNWFLKSSGWSFACSIVPRVFRWCSAAVARPSGLLFAVQSVRLARPHKTVPLLLITLIFIYYDEICGGASKQPNDGSPEPNRRGKQWIGAVWLKKVFRGGVRGCPRGCPRRSSRVFRAHRQAEESNQKSKIVVFWGNVKKVSAEVSAAII